MVQEFPFICMLCVCVFFCVCLFKIWISPLTFQMVFILYLFVFFLQFFVIFTEDFSQDLNYNLSGYIFQVSGQIILRMLVLEVLLVRFWIGHLRLKRNSKEKIGISVNSTRDAMAMGLKLIERAMCVEHSPCIQHN